MIYDIAEILKNFIANESLPYVEQLAGLVQTETKMTPGETRSELVTKSFPIYCPLKGTCDPNNIVPLVPSKEKKSMFYFERNGDVIFTGREQYGSTFTAELWLVGWLNPKALGSDECDISAPIIAQLLKIFNKGQFNDPGGVFSRMLIKPLALRTKEPSIFDKYKYNKKFFHVLEYPYDYFAIRLQVNFALGDSCIDNFIVKPEIKC